MSTKINNLTEVEKAIIDADIANDEFKEFQEKSRRDKLSPRKKQLQASVDMIKIKTNKWDDAAYCDGKSGTDHQVLWESVRALAKLHRHSKTDRNITRWFASWVSNQLLAEINTTHSD